MMSNDYEYVNDKFDDIIDRLEKIEFILKNIDPYYLKQLNNNLTEIHKVYKDQNEKIIDAGRQLNNMIVEHKGVIATCRAELTERSKRNKKRKQIGQAIAEYFEV